jgi:hypothetical protein
MPHPGHHTLTVGPDFTTEIKAARNVDVDLGGAPAATDGVVVSYVTSAEGGLEIVAWNASTGAELCRDAAVAGNGSSAISVDAHIVQTAGRTVVPYIRDLPATTMVGTRSLSLMQQRGCQLRSTSRLAG